MLNIYFCGEQKTYSVVNIDVHNQENVYFRNFFWFVETGKMLVLANKVTKLPTVATIIAISKYRSVTLSVLKLSSGQTPELMNIQPWK